ncbi:uncharacterized protein (DUF2147 family) [Novosphingobium sp. PhB165]|uniref:DUF2147 domain-containing protein n=1 Tax=Novosphingobium sp. PhB165 TaxID=2485105 RepID=UPI001048DE96|nr:DUF2147 domain-containing protein [Novosphingobium sp. PhB165]TCM16425.1 uncharacterized protein (DUF2147 family) [Novosphingobium sp. PhB165]
MKGICMAMACALAIFGSPQTVAAQTGVYGRWLTDDGAGVVEIAPCGSALCGKLVAVLDPKAPAHDINNPDPARRALPLVGVSILTGLVRSGDGWSGGQAYDPKAGRTYRASIHLAQDGRLDVTGCLLFACRTKHWTRFKEKHG